MVVHICSYIIYKTRDLNFSLQQEEEIFGKQTI